MPEIQKPPTIRIPGTPDPAAPRKDTSFVKVTSSRTYRISAARSATAKPEQHPYQPDEVVEIEFVDGTRVWTSSRRLCKELLPQRQPGRGGDGGFELPAGLDRDDAGRGMSGKILFSTLTFLGVDLAGKSAKLIAEKWEEHTLGETSKGRGAGLYRCATDGDFSLTPCDRSLSKLAPESPVLIFLHGTASSTRGSFGELWEPDKSELRRKLFAPYQGNVLALEHGTLSTSPLQNAIDLAEALHRVLQPGARVHLISHSRGGLVGELLCRVMVEGERDPFSAEELAWFDSKDPEGIRGDLALLNGLLKTRPFQVERFVRVACPAWGTSLASNRLDIYLSILFNLLSKVPVLSAVPGCKIVYDIFSELIMLVAKERSDPAVLPGIEAMIPGTPLVQLLNRPGCRVGGELRVIAGGIERGTVLSSVATLITDPLYRTDNDLVVDTEAMFGGAARIAGAAAFSFHHGPLVSHFSYFRNEESASRLLKTISRGPRDDDGFKSFEVYQQDDGRPPFRRGVAGPRPVVFLLPAVMGTHLVSGPDRIWLAPDSIALGLLEKLSIEAPDVKPQEPVWKCYAGLVEYLSERCDVKPFPYDWRLSLESEAARLADEIEEALLEAEKAPQPVPVSIVAHSTGGLLARALIAGRPATWEKLCRHPEARLIMLGTPNGGSYSIAQLLTGRHSLVKQLALLDMKHEVADLVRLFSSCPGILELLPEELFEHDLWEKYHKADARRDQWQVPLAAALREARRVRQAIAESPLDPARVLYLAGHAPATASAMLIDRDDDGNTCLVFHASAEGDGRTLWSTGIPAGLRTWYLPVGHGDLASDEDGFPAIDELLARGKTERAESVAPVTPGIGGEVPLPEERAPLYTRLQDLVSAALGGARERRARKTIRRVRVSVAHGNLAFTKHPVMVGHYQGDTIVSAEDHLDRIMDGRLRNRHRLDLYPGEDDTAEAFLNPKRQPGGAIIIGLGEVGKLSPGKLTRAVSRGVRAYAIALAEGCDAKADTRTAAGIAALLVGTNAGGVSVEDSIAAILRGVDDALQFLQEQGFDERVAIEELEFIEVYEDRAIHAVHALDRARSDPDISRRFLIDPELSIKTITGGLRRASFLQEGPWWRRLEITENRAGRLSFNVLTDRARSEVYLQQSQRALADQFIGEITESAGNTSDDIAVTLFEMLVPNEIKESAPDRQDVVLVLNKESARYPWEMMRERPRQNRGGQPAEPLSVQAGMIRQLQVGQFRDRVVMARGQAALVIGNPRPTPYVSLPGAEDEAREVQQKLAAGGYDSLALLGEEATGGAIMKALYAQDYRIVHLAGHGVYELSEECAVSCDCCGAEKIVNRITGMVIGNDVYLTPAQLAQMHAVPELVFVNCCHLGKVEDPGDKLPANNPPQLAANLATELIAMGVKAVVAAGWEVNDLAAKKFAGAFYEAMLAGVPFGQAVLKARKTIYDDDSLRKVNTWGAYQCYGDHAFCLSGTGGKGATSQKTYRFAAPVEVVTHLDNITQQARTADEKRMAELAAETSAIDGQIPAEWRGSGAILVALASAYGELQDFARAVGYYREALKDEKAPCLVKAVEQLCNLQARYALQVAKTDPAAAREMIKDSEERIGKLNDLLGESAERLSRLGSAAKREAMLETTADGKKKALEKMARRYREAYEKSGDSYPYTNYLTAAVLLSLFDVSVTVSDETMRAIREKRHLAANRQQCVPDFWTGIASADFLLLEHLADRRLAEESGRIIEEYLDTTRCYGSPREHGSVFEQLDFLIETIAAAPEEVKDKLSEPLARIRSSVAGG